MQAAIRAINTTAFDKAAELLQSGKDLLSENVWTTNYNLIFEINSKLTESYLITGKHQEGEQLFDYLKQKQQHKLKVK